MTYLGKLAVGSVAALTLSMPTQALATSHQIPIHILCDGAELAPLCDGVRAALHETDESRSVRVVDQPAKSEALTVQFLTARHERHILSGHLVWTKRDGTRGEGPVMELSVIDAPLNDDLLRDYGRQLVQFTSIPL